MQKIRFTYRTGKGRKQILLSVEIKGVKEYKVKEGLRTTT